MKIHRNLLASGLLLSSLQLSSAASFFEVFVNSTDPACHSGVPPRVITMTGDPTPYNPPSTLGGGDTPAMLWEDEKDTDSPTQAPTSAPTIADCDNWIKSYSLIDTETDEVVPGYEKLWNGQTLVLSELKADGHKRFTIRANVEDDGISQVQFYLSQGGNPRDTRNANGFTVNGRGNQNTNLSPWEYLNIAGTYTIKARGYNPNNSPRWEPTTGDDGTNPMCQIKLTIDYGNPGFCSGLVESFSLINTTSQEPIKGYEVLAPNSTLVLKDLHNRMGIVANTNGFERGQVYFGLGRHSRKRRQTSAPYSLGSKRDGDIYPLSIMRIRGEYEIYAYALKQNRRWEPVSEACRIKVRVEYGNDGVCPGLVERLALVDVESGQEIEHHEDLRNWRKLYLNNLPRKLSIKAVTNGFEDRVMFRLGRNTRYRQQTSAPYYMGGKNRTDSMPYALHALQNDGNVTIAAKGLRGDRRWEGDSEACTITLQIFYGNEGRCKGLVSQLQIINTETGEPVKGYEKLRPENTINLESPNIPAKMAIAAVGTGSEKGIYFGLNNRDRYRRRNYGTGYYMGGTSRDGRIYPQHFLRIEGTYSIRAKGQQMDNRWEPNSEFCSVSVTVDYGDEGICDNLIKGFGLFNIEDQTLVPGHESLPKNGTVIDLSEADTHDLTVVALGRGVDTGVRFGFGNRNNYRTVGPGRVYSIGGNNNDVNKTARAFTPLKVAGKYLFKAKGRKADGRTWERDSEMCSTEVKVIYGAEDAQCSGLVRGFSLVQIEEDGNYTEVEGFDLGGGPDIVLSEFPRPLTVLAHTVGVERQIQFGLDNRKNIRKVNPGTDYIISGKHRSGAWNPFSSFMAAGTYTVMAKARKADGSWESDSDMCKFTVNVKYGAEGPCSGLVSGFKIADALDNEYLADFSPVKAGQSIDLDIITNPLTIVADAFKFAKEVRFDAMWEGRHNWRNWYRKERDAPYAMAGDRNGDFKALGFLNKIGTHKVRAKAKNMLNRWEPDDQYCEMTITVKGTVPIDVNNPPPIAPESPPKKILIQSTTTDDEDVPCAPAYIQPITGDVMYYKTPIEVVDRKVNESISFKTINYIKEGEVIDWVSTSFVMPAGVRVCHMVENLGIGKASPEIYTTKCFDGFAYVDLYAHDDTFNATSNNADTSKLHSGCQKPGAGGKIKYSFIISCDCANIPEVPAEIWGGPFAKTPKKCVGRKSGSWGDPHLTTWDGKKFDCQGNGEFKTANAVILNKPYELNVQSRFRKFEASKWGARVSFNDGLVISQDHSVQFSRADVTNELTTMFGSCPINFYVDGVQRNLLHGTGIQHKVMVFLKSGMKVETYFPETGVTVYGRVRPGSPCKFDYDICIPEDNKNIVNVTGLFGNHDGNSNNDFRNQDNQPVAIQRGRQGAFDYCTKTWCIRDKTESLFAYDSDDFGFDHFQRCDAYTAGGSPDLSAASDEVKQICGCAGEADIDDPVSKFCYPDCVLDGLMGGPDDARIAMSAIRAQNAARLAALFAPLDEEGACCSFDFKLCMESSDADKTQANVDPRSCSEYLAGASKQGIWLNGGEYGDDSDFAQCKALNARCETHNDCCPGLGCDGADKCVPMDFGAANANATDTGARRLMYAPRPDLEIAEEAVLLSSVTS